MKDSNRIILFLVINFIKNIFETGRTGRHFVMNFDDETELSEKC